MDTKILKIDKERIDTKELEQAIEVLRSGGLVAFPTETVYGLGADALNPEASARIYQAKGRPSDNPLIIHIAREEDLTQLAEDIPEAAYRLSSVFWPGPLTMILKKKASVPRETTGGLDTVAIRLPAHKLARTLIKNSGIFVAAPSANLSGKPSPTKAEHVIRDLSGRVDIIIDGGQATLGLESTIIDLTGTKPLILRPGCITKAMLEHVIGPVDYDPVIMQDKPDEKLIPKAPGMKYRHYAPEGCLTIYEGKIDEVITAINLRAKELVQEGKTVGIIATSETEKDYLYGTVKTIGSRLEEDSIAAGLYGTLRDFDELKTEYIFSESFADNDLGQAIMNRLLKAAGYRIVKLS